MVNDLEQIVKLELFGIPQRIKKEIRKVGKSFLLKFLFFVLVVFLVFLFLASYSIVKNESLDRVCREIVPGSKVVKSFFYETVDCEKGSEIIKIGKGTHINDNKD